MEIASPEVNKRSGPSVVWIIPLVTLLVGGWLVFKTLSEQGPQATISFKTAEGIEVGKTKVKYKSVDIGVVEVQKQKLLMLYVQNPQEYIRSQKNAFKRTIMQINYKSYSTPISIGVHGLKCNFDELHALLKQYMELARL